MTAAIDSPQAYNLITRSPASLDESSLFQHPSVPSELQASAPGLTKQSAATYKEMILTRTLQNVLAWIRAISKGNSLPEAVVNLIHPLLLPEISDPSNPVSGEPNTIDEMEADIESENYETNLTDAAAHDLCPPNELRAPAELKLVDLSSILSETQNEEMATKHNCPYCSQDFESMAELSKHSLTHCLLPLRRLRDKYILQKRAELDGSNSVSVTGRTRNKEILKQKAPHQSCQLSSYSCPVCAQIFTGMATLALHVREEHPASFAFTCKTCGQGFKSTAGFSQHVHNRSPAQSKESLCSLCGKTFAAPFQLAKHTKRVHTEKRDYKCSYCPSAFKTHCALREHTRRHLKTHQKQCPHCGCFKTSNNINNHIRLVHEGKRFKCKVCGNLYYSTHDVREHFSLKHADLSDSTITLSNCFTVTHVDVVRESHKIGKQDSGQSMHPSAGLITAARRTLPDSTLSQKESLPSNNSSTKKHSKTSSARQISPVLKKTLQNTHRPAIKTRVCEICNHPIRSNKVAWEAHMIKHKRDPNYRMKPRLNLKYIDLSETPCSNIPKPSSELKSSKN